MAWAEERNEAQVGINWRFTTAKARIKLRRRYPSPNSGGLGGGDPDAQADAGHLRNS
jgi:hypothetical protein